MKKQRSILRRERENFNIFHSKFLLAAHSIWKGEINVKIFKKKPPREFLHCEKNKLKSPLQKEREGTPRKEAIMPRRRVDYKNVS